MKMHGRGDVYGFLLFCLRLNMADIHTHCK